MLLDCRVELELLDDGTELVTDLIVLVDKSNLHGLIDDQLCVVWRNIYLGFNHLPKNLTHLDSKSLESRNTNEVEEESPHHVNLLLLYSIDKLLYELRMFL